MSDGARAPAFHAVRRYAGISVFGKHAQVLGQYAPLLAQLKTIPPVLKKADKAESLSLPSTAEPATATLITQVLALDTGDAAKVLQRCFDRVGFGQGLRDGRCGLAIRLSHFARTTSCF